MLEVIELEGEAKEREVKNLKGNCKDGERKNGDELQVFEKPRVKGVELVIEFYSEV